MNPEHMEAHRLRVAGTVAIVFVIVLLGALALAERRDERQLTTPASSDTREP